MNGTDDPKPRLIPPVALLLSLAGVAFLTDRLVPWRVEAGRAPVLAAGIIAAVGIAVALLGVIEFRRARTTVDPMHPTRASAIVSTGVFRRTRNPMYVGFALLLLAWCAWLANPLALASWLAFVAYLDRVQIPAEEQALRERFGEAFTEYAARTRRWL